MFNPKGSNLLDEQLAVSGLEMSVVIDPFSAASAVFSIGSGIAGMFGASKSNAAAKRAAKKQERLAKKAAKKTNNHNRKLDAAEKANYRADRKFEYESRVINHEFDSKIVDIKNAAANAQFEKSEQISAVNLGLNEQGSEQAIDTQIASIQDKFVEQQFAQETALSSLKSTYFNQSINKQKENVSLQGIRNKQNIGSLQFQNTIQELMTKTALTKESNLVDSLLAQGKASLGQAGGSAIKNRQSIKAGLQRSLQGLSIELSGKNKQAALELANLNAETSLSKTGVGLNLQVIDDAISSAEEEAVYNQRVSKANIDSFLNQSDRNLADISLKKSVADINVLASKMIKPTDIPYAPTPRETPHRKFVRRMKVRPSFVTPPTQQSTIAPLLGGIASAANALAGVDFGGQGGGSGGFGLSNNSTLMSGMTLGTSSSIT